MSAILHITKPGHKCPNPYRFLRARNFAAGERVQVGAWELFKHHNGIDYIVCRADFNGDHYEFTNLNCAAAKLAELGRK